MRVYQLRTSSDQREQSQDKIRKAFGLLWFYRTEEWSYWACFILQGKGRMTLKVIQRSSGLPFLPSTGIEHTGLEGKSLSFLVSKGESPSWVPGARLPSPGLEPQEAGLLQKATGAELLPRATGMTLMPQLRGRQSIQPEDWLFWSFKI